MNLYFRSNQIPALANYNFKQRAYIISIALSLLSPPQKFILNVIKLFMLSTLFIAIARFEGWNMTLPLIGLVVFYPLITHPLSFHMANKNLDKAIKKYQVEQQEQEEID